MIETVMSLSYGMNLSGESILRKGSIDCTGIPVGGYCSWPTMPTTLENLIRSQLLQGLDRYPRSLGDQALGQFWVGGGAIDPQQTQVNGPGQKLHCRHRLQRVQERQIHR
jgi:hypothetical protein